MVQLEVQSVMIRVALIALSLGGAAHAYDGVRVYNPPVWDGPVHPDPALDAYVKVTVEMAHILVYKPSLDELRAEHDRICAPNGWKDCDDPVVAGNLIRLDRMIEDMSKRLEELEAEKLRLELEQEGR